jgi:hypothetical protein
VLESEEEFLSSDTNYSALILVSKTRSQVTFWETAKRTSLKTKLNYLPISWADRIRNAEIKKWKPTF